MVEVPPIADSLRIILTPTGAAAIRDCVRIARRVALHLNSPVVFTFNDIDVNVPPDPKVDIESIVADYFRRSEA